MRDFLRTVVPLGKSMTKKVMRKIRSRPLFHENAENNESIHKITKHYEDKIKDALLWDGDIQEIVYYILENIRLIKSRHLNNEENDEENKKLIFDQIIIFINFLYKQLSSKSFYNYLTNNNLTDFNDKNIWNKITNIILKEWKLSQSWSFCTHYALLFKHIFDEIEKRIKLWTSNYLFIEKTNWRNHAWLVVIFQWTYYLVDSSSFNHKCMQPINELWGEHYERMKILLETNVNDIPADRLETAKNKYLSCNYNYYKVPLKTSKDLLSLLDSTIKEKWNSARIYNIFGNKLWVNFTVSKEWIQLLGTFFYHFDPVLINERLDNISDTKLMDHFINCISYKTTMDSDENIKVFNFEKKYIRDILYYFSDKIDYSDLRRLFSNT